MPDLELDPNDTIACNREVLGLVEGRGPEELSISGIDIHRVHVGGRKHGDAQPALKDR
jgi:hypothetical protein